MDGIGTKNDNGKIKMRLILPEFLEEMAKVLTYGAGVHGDYNWQNVESYRFEDSLCRHVNNWRKGELIDNDEPNNHNLVAAAVNCMFLWWKDNNESIKPKGDASENCIQH